MQKICIIGLGYIGLPTAAVFARAGYEVVGVDVNEQVVELLNKGEIIIEETGLPEVVKEAVESGKLRASLKPEAADAFIIAVPTPVHEDHTANVDYVVSAAQTIVPFVKKGDVVIVESTIPPRTIDDVVAPIFREAGFDPEQDLHLAHCPERVLPGRILIELVENARIVGGLTPAAAEKAADVYRRVVTGDILVTEAVTAEMSKLMENTFRDVNIALANELAKICGVLGVDAHKVIELANRHPRVNLHQPGPGVGGHCLAVDPYFIVEKAPVQAQMIQMSRDINNSMPDYVVDQIIRMTGDIERPSVALFGLTYKGNIDDVRESPAIEIVEKVIENPRFDVRVHDPHVRNEQVSFPLASFDQAVEEADLVVILADHNEFKALDTHALMQKMARPVIFDTKNCTGLTSGGGLTVHKIGDLRGLARNEANAVNK
ncbi:nucleotide sugar dehydrogenase [Domibacillus indicus]|uniref:nucleotide sugar dehydrogenase n=1 Tax=Domibacillus indicus TaxID=1437523 RepID=UPI0006180F7D|nr:nucleotide sugar dehydrogenase [Domibacillus indicus]